MSSPERPDDRPALVRRLRTAGCVLAEEEAALLGAAAAGEALEALVVRREAGEPLEHVLGWAAFGGLRVVVGPGVFVPRRSSLTLVALADEHLAPLTGAAEPPVVVDLCCGSAAVAAAVSDRHPGAEVHAADLDPAAVACARRNLSPDRVHAGDLYAALPAHLRGRVDVLVCHPPYVPTGEIALLSREARLHEHPDALDGGSDGLEVVRRVAAGAAEWLAPGGVLLLETSGAALAPTRAVLATHLAGVVVREGPGDGLAVLARADSA